MCSPRCCWSRSRSCCTPLIADAVGSPVLQTAATVFVAVCLQALPFLVLGAVLSAAFAVFVSPAC